MKKLIWLIDISLDGFMSGLNGELDWLGVDVDDEFWNDVNDLLGTVDTALFGRLTYQNFEQYWPNVTEKPGSPKHEVNFSRWIDETPKYVASSTLSQPKWKNSTVLKSEVANQVSKLKAGTGKGILIFGSCHLALQLLDANLMDEMQLRIHPTVLGEGRSAFHAGLKSHRLKLIQSRQFQTGVIRLRYQL